MLEVIKKRRSIRKYQPREVEEEKLNEILQAAMFAPSAMNCRPWEFVVVKNKETRERLSGIKSSIWLKEAPMIIVLCANGKTDPLWMEDLSIAADHIYLEAENQGLGTCFVQIANPEGKEDEIEKKVKRIINAPMEIRILCLMPLGYPAEEKTGHPESEFERTKIHSERW